MSRFRLLVVIPVLQILIQNYTSVCFANSTNGEPITVESLIKEMSVEEKVGQLLLLGIRSRKFDSQLSRLLRELKPGGVVVFRQNIRSAEQISELNYRLQAHSIKKNDIPIFISVDQEGGLVTRIKRRPPLPSALALGETRDPGLVNQMGFYTGTLMKTLGFNMNLAPVVDIASPNENTFIGTRSFGGDYERAGKMALSFARGLETAGVISTLKHYPGHGGPAGDSHKKIPIMETTLDSLFGSHLKPFISLTSSYDVPAIMVAHVLYPKIDRHPATYSKVLVDRVLREKLQFSGLIITDDIEMAGAKQIKDPGEQATKALEAGVDMIMVAWHRKSQTKAFKGLVKAVKSGRISQERLDKSVSRILQTKMKYGLFSLPRQPSLKTIRTVFSDPSFKKSVERVISSNIKKSLETINVDTLKTSPRPIYVLAYSKKFYESFTKPLEEGCCRFIRLSKRLSLKDHLARHPRHISVAYVSGKTTLNAVNSLHNESKNNILLVNTGVPALIKSPEIFLGVINLFTPNADSGQMIAEEVFLDTSLDLRKPSSEKTGKRNLRGITTSAVRKGTSNGNQD